MKIITVICCFDICDRLCINHPFTAKIKLLVRPKITAKSAHDGVGTVLAGYKFH